MEGSEEGRLSRGEPGAELLAAGCQDATVGQPVGHPQPEDKGLAHGKKMAVDVAEPGLPAKDNP
jgi:hypothetical protein